MCVMPWDVVNSIKEVVNVRKLKMFSSSLHSEEAAAKYLILINMILSAVHSAYFTRCCLRLRLWLYRKAVKVRLHKATFYGKYI